MRKMRKKYLVTIRLSSSATWLLHVACFNCDDAHNVLFCCFPLRAFLCVSFLSFLVIEYAKKQSQPTWCFRDSLLHCIALPVTCCFSIGSIISHSFPAFSNQFLSFQDDYGSLRGSNTQGNPSRVKIFPILSKRLERPYGHVTDKICIKIA